MSGLPCSARGRREGRKGGGEKKRRRMEKEKEKEKKRWREREKEKGRESERTPAGFAVGGRAWVTGSRAARNGMAEISN